ncbi:unnamed protein product [Cuscuta campestris]|uniref:Integrase catalytic domain-containing protein n=1 Tax=Cuscuta campestris TaxID=132261 RepID=A0A484KEP0_9ASTE|nr:unnamed protein product [Cuscuta campestris]
MADENSSSGKVISTADTSSSNNSPHLAFTTISNIKLHIPVQLSLSAPNYKKWSRLFRLLILRFNLKGFIDGTTLASSADDAEWYQFDALIQGWILSTITDEVSDLVLANNLSAHALWKAIYNLFHDNKHARAMQLEHRFRTTVKGHLSIDEYCRLLKNLSEYLDDVDAPVTEHALVLQVLQGLPHDIRGQVQFLQYQNLLLTFLEVRSALLLVEQQQTDAVYGAGAPSTALLSTGGGGGHTSSGHRQDRGGGYGGYGSSGSSGFGGGFGGGSSGRGKNSGGILSRFSCPYTSQQNGRAERTIRTLNNTVRTLLFQANLPPHFWVEALHMATHLFNILPTTTLNNRTPHEVLYRTPHPIHIFASSDVFATLISLLLPLTNLPHALLDAFFLVTQKPSVAFAA